MKPDVLSFARAARVALLGMLVQGVIGVVLLIYSVLGADIAAQGAAYLILCGLAVWVTLAVLFDQHRRERIEALEAEMLGTDGGRAASVFESAGEDLKVAGRRLQSMHAYLVPTVSLLLAVGLIVLAWWRLRLGEPKVTIEEFTKVRPLERGWAISLGLSIAVIGFIFGRYVSGMAKQKVWSNLRGGAGQAVGASLLGLLLALSHLIDLGGSDWLLRVSLVVVPAFSGLLGIEIIVNFLLNLYRPRKPGEIPRPAFDSPILGFVSSPDRIASTLGGAVSYQFGVDVTGSWAYRLLSRAVLPLVLFGSLVVALMTAITVIAPNEQGLLMRGGRLVRTLEPGIHFKLPWPFESVDRLDATGVRQLTLATPRPGDEIKAVLWTNDHGIKEGETFALVQPVVVGGAEAGAADLAKIAVEVPLLYRVANLRMFEDFAPPQMRDVLLKSIAKREMNAFFATLTEDQLLGQARAAASAELNNRIRAAFTKANTGVEVVFCGIESVHPDKDVAPKFEEVVKSQQQYEQLVEIGQAEAITVLTTAVGSLELARSIAAEIDTLTGMQGNADAAAIRAQEQKIETLISGAGGKAAAMLARARADRWTKSMTERGRAESMEGRLAAYQANPSLFKARLYFEMLIDALKESRLYVTADTIPDLRIQLDLKDMGTGDNAFTNPTVSPK